MYWAVTIITLRLVSVAGKVEYYLKKKLLHLDKNTDDSSLPTWGREYAYALLIQYYMQNDRTDEAKKLLADGREGVSGQLFYRRI